MDDNIITIYLTRIYLQDNMDLDLESYFKKFFLKMKHDFNIEISGYYTIDVYQDNNYGYIIKIEREDFDYFEYLENQVDMKIKVHEDINIYYELTNSDIKSFFPYLKFYVFKNKIYGIPKTKITTLILGKILEMSEDVYCDETGLIENCGKQMTLVD